ncbi:MAG: hypothetical protein JSU61_04630 [Fidelibacterota bacterium]|nr:MAG: hypothetical protein JSU61_04630 [Candidatus Neomarinimicrobiota bacterium]
MSITRLSSLPLIFTLLLASGIHAQTEPHREVRLLLGSQEESELIATAGISLNKVLQDLYYRGIDPMLPPKLQPVTEITWSVVWTFMCSMWPHEFGHWARARQTGGDFIVTQFGFPFPKAKMIQPDSTNLREEALSSLGGHEINNLMLRQAHMDFLHEDYAAAVDLIHAFIQEVYYPFYAFVLAPADPEKPDTWTDTWGDPVESALIVFKSHSGRPPIREDGSVDPDLVSHYRETTYLSLLWTLLDPLLYQTARAFGTDMRQDYGLMRPRLLGNDNLAWIWSTQFHYSPLGYELYLANYLRRHQKLYVMYLKAGRPYKNLGLGVQVPALLETGKLTLGAAWDLWSQDIYGDGVALYLDAAFQVSDKFGLLLKAGWKDDGYLVGRRVDQSTLLLAGLSYRY